MASRAASPGGALLRASRVFSIPPALPRPPPDLSSSVVFNSETATLPHPTHLSITTPQSSLKKGDWGFKRPLPLRSTTKTSTPIIRVKAIDTWEHITDYGSSADHALTLVKWQEMGLPLLTPTPSDSYANTTGRKSVFDDEIDDTVLDEASKTDVRWKFKGPWLAGLSDGEFRRYLAREVQKRKGEFKEILRTECARALTAEARLDTSGNPPPPVQASEVTPKQLTDYTKSLRTNRRELYRLIRNLFDLPPAPTGNRSITDEVFRRLTAHPDEAHAFEVPKSDSPYAETGPPKTHPSAGLSYKRTSAYIFNHPIFGPQKYNPPVQARIVMPKNAATGAFPAVLGVGGFITAVPDNMDTNRFNVVKTGRRNILNKDVPGMDDIEPDKVGGSKTYVHPDHARIDPRGRVILTVTQADPEAIAVLEGTTDKIPQMEALRSSAYVAPSLLRGTGYSNTANTSGQKGYGLSLGNGSGNERKDISGIWDRR